MRKILVTSAAFVAAFAFTVPAQAQTNGGFETGDFTGWTQTGNTTFNGVTCPGPGATVREGNCSAFFGAIGSPGGITQAVTTVAGQGYLFNFSFYSDGGTPGSFNVLFDGNSVLSLTNPPASGWTDYSFGVYAGDASSDLAFNFRNDPGFYFLDRVSLTAVPEPATWAMMLVGFGAIGTAVRRRRKEAVFEALA